MSMNAGLAIHRAAIHAAAKMDWSLVMVAYDYRIFAFLEASVAYFTDSHLYTSF